MSARLFFRIDDLGWQHDKFLRVLALFREKGQKLNAAAIPMPCLENIKPGTFDADGAVLEIHCHGFSHLDHQNAGKKAEFGSQRKPEAVLRDLRRAQEILRTVFGSLYQPIFTPPWNRMDESFVPLLSEAGFRGLSRDGDKRAGLRGLADLNVDIDLHTRKDGARLDTEDILKQIRERLDRREDVGVMLHHTTMTPTDLEQLSVLLDAVKARGWETSFMSGLR